MQLDNFEKSETESSKTQVITVERSVSSISAEVAPDLRLRDILKTLPKEVFIQNRVKAWSASAINVLLVVLGYVGLAIAPWFLIPFLWVFTGTALTGFFVLGHDCGHRSFAKRRWVNDLVGHIMFLPLLYPFHSWRIQHNHHHKHTNKLDVDTAWNPLTPENYEKQPWIIRLGYLGVRWRFWWLGSIAHWFSLHFDWSKFPGKQREQVRFSVLVVAIAGTLGLPTLIATLGISGFVKFWLMPWLVYHFWMSTFTLVHHTTAEVPFKTPDQWHEATAQLAGTIHCDYPGWVEYLCHDINVHVPHHITTAIPFYNLRQAYQSIKEQWGEYCAPERQFSWQLMQEITDDCHLYVPSRNAYQSYGDYQAELKTQTGS